LGRGKVGVSASLVDGPLTKKGEGDLIQKVALQGRLVLGEKRGRAKESRSGREGERKSSHCPFGSEMGEYEERGKTKW